MPDDPIEQLAASEEECIDCQPPAPANSGSTAAHATPIGVVPNGGTSTSATDGQAILPPQPDSLYPSIMIEFCDRCRWAPRATWIQTELFLTFRTPVIRSITLMPLTLPETGGRFRVWIETGRGGQLVWDRKTEGGFPELKVLKQRVRNILQPDLNLGHSDVKSKQASVPFTTG